MTIQEDNIGFDNMGNDDLDKVMEQVNVTTSTESDSAIATKKEIDLVIKHILTEKKLPITQDNYNRVTVTVSHLVQIGATSPKFTTTRQVTDYGVDVKVSDLNNACKQIKITVRKFARGIRDTVIYVASRHKIEGNLAKNYKLENPDYDQQDLIWVSDFQTFSKNTSMPEHVKKWLLNNYKNRFRPEKN